MAVAAARLRDVDGSLAAARWRRGDVAAAALSATVADDGRGEGKGDRRSDGDAMATECAMVTQGRRKAGRHQRYEIEEEEIAREYDEGALPLVAMPLLLHAHLLVQGHGF